MDKALAHVKQNPDGSWAEPHFLEEHLRGVADLAAQFAGSFGNADWAYCIGIWHDLGKFLQDWQAYLRRDSGYDPDAHLEGNSNNRPNHSSAGAANILLRYWEKVPPAKRHHCLLSVIAYAVLGHHAGLPDWSGSGGSLITRLLANPVDAPERQHVLDTELKQIQNNPEATPFLEIDLPKTPPANRPDLLQVSSKHEYLQLWGRLLYSCLVDADFLDTERYMDPESFKARANYPKLNELKMRFDSFMAAKAQNATPGPINQQRRAILDQCRIAANQKPGFFDLNVPTGGGKTLSSMAFALEHAIQHNKSRIIMAIPYTSIIEQTAAVYTEVFGEGTVLEHHSNLDPDKESRQSRLASENWDAPIVVTTNVQLFESLLAARSSANRKLHNIVDAVIILDEAQMLPHEYFRPILSTLQGLVEFFGVTVVLCTATQPVLEGSIGSGTVTMQGIRNVRHIIQNPEELAKSFRRVQIRIDNPSSPRGWSELAQEINTYEQILVVVNSRNDARELHQALPPETVHLSASMCGEERSEVISAIKKRLQNNEPIRVVSTQLVEAGVDLDFPVVYRALAGLDSIAQAAGRCNREGRLNAVGATGKVVVFTPPKPAAVGLLRKGQDTSRSILFGMESIALSQELFDSYFREFYSRLTTFDGPDFQSHLVENAASFQFQYRSFAEKVHLIDNQAQELVIVLYKGQKNSSFELVEELRKFGPNQRLSRKLQRFVITLPRQQYVALEQAGCFEKIHGYTVQAGPGLYKPGIGFLGDKNFYDPETCMV